MLPVPDTAVSEATLVVSYREHQHCNGMNSEAEYTEPGQVLHCSWANQQAI